jgi:hypothetical protein
MRKTIANEHPNEKNTMNKFIPGARAALLTGVVALSSFLSLPSSAQVVALDRGQEIGEKRTGWLPYIFATESLGTALGVGGFSASGKKQPQSYLFGTAFVTSNESALLSGAWGNVRLGDSRWFFDSFLLLDHFTDQRFYLGDDVDPGQPRAGTNDSDEENYVTGVSNEVTLNLTLKYRLPIGGIKDDPVAVYRLHQGLLESGPAGGREWNPLTSGQTTFGTQFFYTYRDLSDIVFNERENDPVDELLFAKTNGLKFWLEYDNTDFPRNPSTGSRQLLKLSRDFGWGESTNSWTNLEADLSKYFNLGNSDWFRQKVVALNFWTSNTTTWDQQGDEINNRPPPSYGSG